MRRFFQWLSIWFFRKSFKLPNVAQDQKNNKSLQKLKNREEN